MRYRLEPSRGLLFQRCGSVERIPEVTRHGLVGGDETSIGWKGTALSRNDGIGSEGNWIREISSALSRAQAFVGGRSSSVVLRMSMSSEKLSIWFVIQGGVRWWRGIDWSMQPVLKHNCRYSGETKVRQLQRLSRLLSYSQE